MQRHHREVIYGLNEEILDHIRLRELLIGSAVAKFREIIPKELQPSLQSDKLVKLWLQSIPLQDLNVVAVTSLALIVQKWQRMLTIYGEAVGNPRTSHVHDSLPVLQCHNH